MQLAAPKPGRRQGCFVAFSNFVGLPIECFMGPPRAYLGVGIEFLAFLAPWWFG